MTHNTWPEQGTGRPADPFTERTPRVVSASKLHRVAARRKSGRFLAEGANSVDAALSTGAVVELFCTEQALERFAELVNSAANTGVTISVVSDRAARTLSDTITPTGIVAVCRTVIRERTDESVEAPRLIAVGQALAEPGNVGTLIRVSDALGAEAVWLTEGTVDPENPKAVRASAGSLFHMPVVRGIAESELVDHAHARGLQVVVATGDGDVSIEDADDVLAGPTAWVFGNEAHGVPDALSGAADVRIRIPLRGRAESLNIVTAASICLHTSARLQAGLR